MAELETMTLKGSIMGFAFDVKLEEVKGGAQKALRVTGSLGNKPVDVILAADANNLNLSGRLFGKECIVNGSKNFD